MQNPHLRIVNCGFALCEQLQNSSCPTIFDEEVKPNQEVFNKDNMRGVPTGNPSFLISRVMAEEKKDFDGKWLAIGVAIGVAIGAAMGNISLGICIGLGLGAAVALNEKNKKKDKEEK